ncbi:MAG: 2,3-dihydroxybiphenyl 1,2-dioxygenase [Dehalococcoidia bacterium]|nr:2,3-dihydroxybiphenyl 1,2-dioxygenase [Dehalococcoidia bacterium]
MDKVSISQLGYVGHGVSNMTAWEDFAATLGIQDNGRDKDGAMFLKLDENHHRMIVHPNGNDDVSYIGWQVANEPQLKAMAQQLKSEGVEIMYGTPDEAKKRRVMGLIKMEDPNGIPTEIFYGPEVSYGNDFKSPAPANVSGWVTGVLGTGHAVITVTDYEKSLHFYQDLLGFRMSDIMMSRLQERGMGMAFFHCNPRHHSLAFMVTKPREGTPQYNMPQKKLNHIMLQMNTLDDVGAAYYRCQEKGVAFRMSLGRHGNDQMVSFYVITPSGWAIECGWGGRTVDDATWQVTTTADDPWGHVFNPQFPPITARVR